MYRNILLVIIICVTILPNARCQEHSGFTDFDIFCDSLFSEVQFDLTLEHAKFYLDDSLASTAKQISFDLQCFTLHLSKGGNYTKMGECSVKDTKLKRKYWRNFVELDEYIEQEKKFPYSLVDYITIIYTVTRNAKSIKGSYKYQINSKNSIILKEKVIESYPPISSDIN